ncbi:MAG TPA: hypothetical protein VHZ25_17950 [Acidobacteriaceae bacterium]|jgi:hypothetical protein|nr:hypothetical protein [Acidobacteriaceae bacterium]
MPKTQTKHTQGDWRIDGQFDAETSVMIVADYPDFDDLIVVEIEPQLENWSEQEITNIRLMAAAKKLLEAVKFCRSVINANGPFEMSEKLAITVADAAIALAEGRA